MLATILRGHQVFPPINRFLMTAGKLEKRCHVLTELNCPLTLEHKLRGVNTELKDNGFCILPANKLKEVMGVSNRSGITQRRVALRTEIQETFEGIPHNPNNPGHPSRVVSTHMFIKPNRIEDGLSIKLMIPEKEYSTAHNSSKKKWENVQSARHFLEERPIIFELASQLSLPLILACLDEKNISKIAVLGINLVHQRFTKEIFQMPVHQDPRLLTGLATLDFTNGVVARNTFYGPEKTTPKEGLVVRRSVCRPFENHERPGSFKILAKADDNDIRYMTRDTPHDVEVTGKGTRTSLITTVQPIPIENIEL